MLQIGRRGDGLSAFFACVNIAGKTIDSHFQSFI